MKTLLSNLKIKISRKFTSMSFSLSWAFKKVRVLKPLHINNKKFVKLGEGTSIDYSARLDCYKVNDKFGTIDIGKNTMIAFNFTALSGSKLTIGNDVLIASNVFISTINHGINDLSKKYIDQELTTKDVFIDDNAWIGEKVCIMPGVTIGKYSIIGAGAVVTKDVPEYSMAVGNPARIIKKYDLNLKKWINV